MNTPERIAIQSRLAERAHEILVRELRGFGNTVSVEHSEALRSLEYAYTDTIDRRNCGRIAWPMSVGGGKTESIAALAAAAHELREPVSILVSQNTIEALCKLKRRMIELGVPSESIGLVHSKPYDPEHVADAMNPETPVSTYASEPSIEDDPRGYPILLLSHQMLKAREDIHEFNQHGHAYRDLVIWDESLLKSNGRTMDILNLKSAHAAIKVHTGDGTDADAQAAVKFVGFCLAELEAELTEQREGNRPAAVVRLPEKTAEQLLAWRTALANVRRAADASTELQAFLSITQEPLRVVKVARGAVIKYDLLIPSSLKRVVVLDASYNIRELVCTYDQEIELLDEHAGVKDFSAVSVNRLHHGGGRSTIDPALRKRGSSLLKAIIERIQSYDPDKGVLVFTYKLRLAEDRKGFPSHSELIRKALKAAGVDTDATLPNGKPRFSFLTWGQELGLNNFTYCEYVLQVGIYRQSRHALALSIAGQLDDLEAPEAGDSKAIRRVELSEIFHALYQAAGRGYCRSTHLGKAGKMQLDWIGVESFPDEYWSGAMPGASMGEWKSKHVSTKQVAQDGARAILKYLGGLPRKVEYVSCRTLKPGAGLANFNKMAFKRAREQADKSLVGWSYVTDRRGYIRCPFV